MIKSLTFSLLLTSIVLTQVGHAAVIVTSATRAVLADDKTNPAQLNSSSAASGNFNQSVTTTFNVPETGEDHAEAAQNTDISALSFSGTGSSFINGEILKTPEAHSFFDVFFDLTSTFAFSGGVTLDTNIDGGGASATFLLTGPGTNISLSAPQTNTPLNGFLGVGSYELLVKADSVGDGGFSFDQANFDFNLALRELQTVPEPATLALLGLTFVGIGLAKGRKLN